MTRLRLQVEAAEKFRYSSSVVSQAAKHGEQLFKDDEILLFSLQHVDFIELFLFCLLL